MTRGNQNSFSNSFCSGIQNKLEMKEIELTQGLFTQVDDEDFEYLNQWKWYAIKSSQTYYAVRRDVLSKKIIQMHRIIMD
jgi:hypothetical protein